MQKLTRVLLRGCLFVLGAPVPLTGLDITDARSSLKLDTEPREYPFVPRIDRQLIDIAMIQLDSSLFM